MSYLIVKKIHIGGLVQNCGNSSALGMELLQSCTKPSIYWLKIFIYKIPTVSSQSLIRISFCVKKHVEGACTFLILNGDVS